MIHYNISAYFTNSFKGLRWFRFKIKTFLSTHYNTVFSTIITENNANTLKYELKNIMKVQFVTLLQQDTKYIHLNNCIQLIGTKLNKLFFCFFKFIRKVTSILSIEVSMKYYNSTKVEYVFKI